MSVKSYQLCNKEAIQNLVFYLQGKQCLVCELQDLTSCHLEPSSRRHVNKEAYGLSSVRLKKYKYLNFF